MKSELYPKHITSFAKGSLCLLISLTSCSESPTPTTPPIPDQALFIATYSFSDLVKSTDFEGAKITGQLTDARFWEASGIGASQLNKGMFYTEEDSGNPNQIQLISEAGETKGIYTIEGVANRDWEDLAIAPGPQQGVSYIYLADIGDNNAQYPTKFIYRFPEPAPSAKATPYTETIKTVDRIELKLPDGIKNAESLLVDPLTKDIYLVSKENVATVYVAPYPQDLTGINTMKKIAQLPFTKITGGAVSPDGTEVILKTTAIICYWKKSSSESMMDIFRKTPTLLPYLVEQQGEAVCFASDGTGYFTLSERPDPTVDQPLYFYRRK